jgi:hypothetical protein
MTSGPGAIDVPPDEAIEEISGLLEMDESKAGESDTAESSEEPEADAAYAATHGVGSELDVYMETPALEKVDSYLVPPPMADEPPTGAEAESASATNLAYEDLLEKLVLPATPAAPDEAEVVEEPPPFASVQPSSPHPSSSSLGNLFQPSAATSEERTVVTANPLLAEEQEAAARDAENYILPPASVATPAFAAPPVVAKPVRATLQRASLALNKVVQISYQKLGIMLLVALLVGGGLSRLMTPIRVVVSAPPAQTPTLVARPVVPVQPPQPANPAPQVVPLPNPAESPAPAPPAAQRAATAEARPSGGIPAAAPAPAESGGGEPRTAARAKVHHATKSPRPPKSAAPKVAPAKPVAAKPAAPKKAAKGGWVDPFAQ